MSRGKLILASLKPAKRAYAEGKFDYIGGAGGQNLEDHSARAYAKAREQLAAQGSKSNQPNSRKALISLANMYQDEPMSKDEMLVFQGGEHMYLDEGVYDLRATLRYLAIQFKKKEPAAWVNRDRTSNLARVIGYVDTTFRISFYRAVRNLVERRLLIRCDDDTEKQLRFVSMRPDIENRGSG